MYSKSGNINLYDYHHDKNLFQIVHRLKHFLLAKRSKQFFTNLLATCFLIFSGLHASKNWLTKHISRYEVCVLL